MKILVEFYFECRAGELSGLFITTKEVYDGLLGKKVYFGEVLGKHSDVMLTIEEEYLTIKSEDQPFIDKLIEVLDYNINGYNPIDYLRDDDPLKIKHYEDWC